MGLSGTNSIIKYWCSSSLKEIEVCTSAKFNDHSTLLPNDSLSPRSLLSNGQSKPSNFSPTSIDIHPSPLLSHPIEIKTHLLPPKDYSLYFQLEQCSHHNIPYVISSKPLSFFYQGLPPSLRHNI